ncbi:MAG: hypothetical protein WC530_10115 [Candidatus Omnitrophota bacterium]
MTVQTFYFFSKMVVWTAPISTPLKLIGVGTAQVAIDKKKIKIWTAMMPPLKRGELYRSLFQEAGIFSKFFWKK